MVARHGTVVRTYDLCCVCAGAIATRCGTLELTGFLVRVFAAWSRTVAKNDL